MNLFWLSAYLHFAIKLGKKINYWFECVSLTTL